MLFPFISAPITLAWLTRDDLRPNSDLHNVEAQRDFCVWWHLHGEESYPQCWDMPPEIERIILEPKLVNATEYVPRFLAWIYLRRPDLQKAFPLTAQGDIGKLAGWYAKYGRNEYAKAPDFPTWFNFPSYLKRRRFGAAKFLDRRPQTPGEAQVNVISKEFLSGGVNLIGYPRAEFGIGEDIRMLSICLEKAGIRHVIYDVKDGPNARQNDNSRASYIGTELPYRTNIHCVSPFDLVRLFLERKRLLFDKHYNIGYLPWELEQFPQDWSKALYLVDEIWAISRHTESAYSKIIGNNVKFMPPALINGQTPKTRINSNSTYRFLCSFDPNSSPERKNPIAVLRAFKLAFPNSDDDVALIFSINGSKDDSSQIKLIIESARQDKRISCKFQTLDKADYLSLLAGSDCFVSPHRAEGLGRNIGEAKAMGVSVLATGYSGSNDFVNVEERVRWELVAIRPGDYPYSAGLTWAEIDVKALAQKMSNLYQQRHVKARVTLSDIYSVDEAAKRYEVALKRLYSFNERHPAIDL